MKTTHSAGLLRRVWAVPLILLLAALAVIALTVACGGDEEEGPTPGTTPGATETAPTTPAATVTPGEVGPGMGSGAYHAEGEGGPHAVWVRDPDIPSDICEKLGMLAGTFHDHLDQKFQLVIEPEPDDDNDDDNGNGPTPPPDAESVGEFIAGVKAEVDQDIESARYGPDGWEFRFYE